MPIADGAHACPFVAFDDDRDERATVPDHRHRCYAEVRPAPRALAHQEAYCLSSAFPVCPTFQDWARRESARARDAATAAADASAAEAAEAADAGDAGSSAPELVVPVVPAAPPPVPPLPDLSPERVDDALARDEAAAAAAAAAADARNDADGEPRRNPPRDWSAPPPWLASSEAAARGGPADPPDFLSRRSDPAQGLAGSAADQLAGGPPPRQAPPPPPVEPRDRSAPSGGDAHAGRDHASRDHDVDFEDRDLPRPALPPRRPRAYDQHLGGPSSGPDWEQPRRYEAYPTIKTRMGLPQIPRLGVMAGAIVVAALALFFLPAILGLGSGQGPNASPTPTARPSRSIAPTPTPAPTAQIYTIKKGDTLSKIATAFGITLEELRAANPAIKDPNKIVEGQQITVPPPVEQVPDEFGGSPSASAAP